MTDADAFLRGNLEAILTDPADDTPRLVLADWLEDNAGTMPCEWCGGSGEDRPPPPIRRPDGVLMKYVGPLGLCPKCEGACRFPDGRRDRAEFVRVQVELAKYPKEVEWLRNMPVEQWAGDEQTGVLLRRLDDLRRRERELLILHRDDGTAAWSEWANLPDHGEGYYLLGYGDEQNQQGIGVGFSRGFVSHVTADYAVLFGGRCGRCVHISNLNRIRECPACRGEGTTPGIAADLFAAQPVTAVTLTGRYPIKLDCDAGSMWNWMSGRAASPEPESPHHVGPDLFALLDLPVATVGGEEMDAKYAPTEQAAIDALSLAAVQLGRSRAKGFTHDGGPCPGCRGTGKEKWSCKVCGNEPREDGEVEHGRGCYRVSEDGGGSEWPDLSPCPDCRGSGRLTLPGLPPLPAGEVKCPHPEGV